MSATATAIVSTPGGGPAGNGYVKFTYNLPPGAPNPQFPANNGVVDTTIANLFQWINSFPEPGDTATAFDLQYRVVGAGSWTAIARQTTSNTFYNMPSGTFVGGNQYEWQVRTVGSKSGNAGAWSSSFFFLATAPPPAPTVIDPVAGQIESSVMISATWNDPGSAQRYQIVVVGDIAGAPDLATIYADTGAVLSGNNFGLVGPMPAGSYPAHVRIRYMTGSVWSAYTDVLVGMQLIGPNAPVVSAVANNLFGTITVSVANPIGGSAPPASSNDIYRSSPYDAEIRVATGVAVNGNWTDYTPGSGVPYTYRAVAIGSNGVGTSS